MIIYFSGTGNSAFVARELAIKLGDENLLAIGRHNVSGLSIRETDNERIVWVFPVYSWGVPPIVKRFLNRLILEGRASDAIHHAVITCGDDIGYADRMWRKHIENKTWKTGSVATVTMPNIYVLMKGFDVDSQEVERRKIENASMRIDEVAQLILRGGKAETVVRGKFAWIKTGIIYPWFVRHAMSPKPFHAAANCISCGKCAECCPMGNISMLEPQRLPRWGGDCALCLRCYHFCPVGAVRYGKATRGKGQYRLFANTKF